MSAHAMLPLWLWLLACLGCVLAGLLVCGALRLAARAWPALRAQRRVWLAAQAVLAATVILPFLPARDQVSMISLAVPDTAAQYAARLPAADPTERSTVQPQPASGVMAASLPPLQASPASHTSGAPAAALGAVTATDAGAGGATSVPAVGDQLPARSAWLPSWSPALAAAPVLWAAIYIAGLAWTLLRIMRARRVWRGLLAGARALAPHQLAAHGGFEPQQLDDIARHRLTVMETTAAVSPMLVGTRRPVLLLPAHLREFDTAQQHLIVAHELQHWRARDPLWLGLSAWLQTLLWFNPAPRWLGARLAWALELDCDSRVLAGRAAHQRKQYAGALLAQWRRQLVAMPAPALAFGGAHADTVADRIGHLRQAAAPALPAAGPWTVAAALGAVLAAGALLQPALTVVRSAEPALPAQAAVVTAAPPDWQNPLDRMRISGFFGVMRKVSPYPNRGLDIAAPIGTPVRAAVAGTVTNAGDLAENNGRYGTTIVIASAGATETVYAHLDTMAVRPGARIAAGQVIGTVGVTGFSTGPHLHFQVRQHGRMIDPATVLSGLDRHATRHALTVRRQQLGY